MPGTPPQDFTNMSYFSVFSVATLPTASSTWSRLALGVHGPCVRWHLNNIIIAYTIYATIITDRELIGEAKGAGSYISSCERDSHTARVAAADARDD